MAHWSWDPNISHTAWYVEDGAIYRMLETVQGGQDRCLGGIENMQSG